MRALLWQYTIFNHWSLAFEFALSRICVSIYCNWESNKCSAKWCLITGSIYHSQLECWNWIIFVIRFQFDLSSASRSFRVTYTLALPIQFGRSFLGTPKNGCNNEIFETNKIFRLHKSKVETISARILSLPFTMAFGIFPHPMRCVSCITVGAHNNTLDWLPKQQSFLACTPYKVFGRGQVHNSGGATSHMQRSQPWLKQLLNEIFAIRMIFFWRNIYQVFAWHAVFGHTNGRYWRRGAHYSFFGFNIVVACHISATTLQQRCCCICQQRTSIPYSILCDAVYRHIPILCLHLWCTAAVALLENWTWLCATVSKAVEKLFRFSNIFFLDRNTYLRLR